MNIKIPSVVSGITMSVSQLGNQLIKKGGDAKYFQSTKKGEIQELKQELSSTNKDKQKEAVKKVIAAMTIGKDVSTLFPHVVNCMQTSNIELKKLVCLYVIKYATLQPELALLTLNTFRKDTFDSNPLIRALAIRTMGCIRLEQVVEYIIEPLRRLCRDLDPYVRKTAAICICKLYDTSPNTVKEQGFIEILTEMLNDRNSVVVSNAIVALADISEASGECHLKLDPVILLKLLNLLSETSEWGQISILDAIMKYCDPDASTAHNILGYIIPRLSHANQAVVLSTIRLILKLTNLLEDPALVKSTQKKLGPPLITLLDAKPEAQYVALRNILLIVQKYPSILSSDFKRFFCKYNDPLYIKLEKLEVLIHLVKEKTVDLILAELKEYATDIDLTLVSKSIKAIGRCAMKIESCAKRCVSVLTSLASSKVDYVVQEIIITMKDLFRLYPSRFDSVLPVLYYHPVQLDDSEAKASFIWVLGEYAERIPDNSILFEEFIKNFHVEATPVKQQILAAAVKFFLKCPFKAQDLVFRVLKLCTEESDEPDLRDRGYIYWRLLSSNPEASKKLVLAEKPYLGDLVFSLDVNSLNRFLLRISSLESVFHLDSGKFMLAAGKKALNLQNEDEIPLSRANSVSKSSGSGNTDTNHEIEYAKTGQYQETLHPSPLQDHYDLLSASESKINFNDESPSAVEGLNITNLSKGETGSDLQKLFPTKIAQNNLNFSEKLQIYGSICYNKNKGRIFLNLRLTFKKMFPLQKTKWGLHIKENPFGLGSQEKTVNLRISDQENIGQASVVLEPNINCSHTPPEKDFLLEIKLENSGIFLILEPLIFNASVILLDVKPASKELFEMHWGRMGHKNEGFCHGNFPKKLHMHDIEKRLRDKRIHLIEKRENEQNLGSVSLICNALTTNKLILLIKLQINPEKQEISVAINSDIPQMVPLLIDFLKNLLEIVTPRSYEHCTN